MINRLNRFGLWSLIGRMIALHDSHDFGQFDRLHHWLVGVLITGTAEVANLATTIMEFKRQADAMLNEKSQEVKQIGQRVENFVNTQGLRALQRSQERTRRRDRQRIY